MKKAWVLLLVSGIACVAAGQGYEAGPCTPVPQGLFQPATKLFPKGLPDGARLAVSGRTLGVLIPNLPEGHRCVLIRREKIVGEYWLAAPTGRTFPRPASFYIGDNGAVAVLRSQAFFAVYLNGTQVAVVDGDDVRGATVSATRDRLYWTTSPAPGSARTFLGRTDFSDLKPTDWPPLLWRSELDGSDRQALIRLDRERIEKVSPVPLYHTLTLAIRPDGKLWLVAPFTDEVMLTESDGHVVRRLPMPSMLKRPEDDPEVRKRMDEDKRRRDQKSVEEATQTDASKQPSTEIKVVSGYKTRIVHAVAARGRDLVVTLNTADPPPPALLLIREADGTASCFEFPKHLLGGEESAIQMVVAEDAVWFRNPFGSIAWDALDALLEPPKKEEGKTR